MNLIIVTGRLTHDVEVKQNGDFVVANFSIAVKSPVNKDVYYPRFSATGKTAEFLGTWGKKGQSLDVTGFVKTVKKEVDGKQMTTTYLEATKVDFGLASAKKEDDESPSAPVQTPVAQTPVAQPAAAKTTAAKTTTAKTTTPKAAAPPPAAPTTEVLEGDDSELPF